MTPDETPPPGNSNPVGPRPTLKLGNWEPPEPIPLGCRPDYLVRGVRELMKGQPRSKAYAPLRKVEWQYLDLVWDAFVRHLGTGKIPAGEVKP